MILFFSPRSSWSQRLLSDSSQIPVGETEWLRPEDQSLRVPSNPSFSHEEPVDTGWSTICLGQSVVEEKKGKMRALLLIEIFTKRCSYRSLINKSEETMVEEKQEGLYKSQLQFLGTNPQHSSRNNWLKRTTIWKRKSLGCPCGTTHANRRWKTNAEKGAGWIRQIQRAWGTKNVKMSRDPVPASHQASGACHVPANITVY